MGKFNLTINASPDPVIEELSAEVSSCYSQYQIRVDVPASETRYVQITSTDTASPALTNVSVTETITSDKTYTLTLFGSNSATTYIAEIRVTVKDTNNTGAVLGTYSKKRRHSGIYC